MSLVVFVLLCAVWTAWQMDSGNAGCDGERYFNAGRAMAQGLDPYAWKGGYIYPPFLAWVFSYFDLTMHGWVWRLVVAISAVMLLSATLALARLDTTRFFWLGTILLLGQSFAGGIATTNAQLPVSALLALALLAVDNGRYRMAGALLGLAAALKVTPALLVVFLVVRAACSRDRRVARAALVAIAVGAVTLLAPWTQRWLELVATGISEKDRSLAGANLSWYAIAQQAGISLPAFVPALLALVATLGVARSRRVGLLPSLAMVVTFALAGSPVAWGFAYLTLLPAVAILVRELRSGHHLFGEARGRALVEYGSLLAFTMIAVNAGHFYLHETWAGRHLWPLFPLLGTLLLARALWRSQAGGNPGTVACHLGTMD